MATIKPLEQHQQQEDLGMGRTDKSDNAPEPPGQQKPLAGHTGPAVRFNSNVEEIAPTESTTAAKANTKDGAAAEMGQPGGELTPAQLQALSQSLQGNPLQERRMNIFSFEPFSLPASRVPSHDDSSGRPSRQHTQSSSAGHESPITTPKSPAVHSPPLTPAGTGAAEFESRPVGLGVDEKIMPRPDVITPQDSNQDSSREKPPPPPRAASSDRIPRRPASKEEGDQLTVGDHRKGIFSVGPGASSSPTSREGSPSRAAASSQYTRPFTPSGDVNDPYAANKRQPQGKIEPRFVFTRKKGGSPGSSSVSLPKSSQDSKRHSGFFPHHHHHHHGKKDPVHDLKHDDNSTASSLHGRNASMADLKRFFKMGPHHHHNHERAERAASPSSGSSPSGSRPGIRTPPTTTSRSQVQVPFADDHGLTSKYGKLGKVLGSGAGGSVRLMKRSEDNTVFAVKEFRPRHSYETEKEYTKKLTAEYCMGSSLHHGNIIETLDIVQEKGKWFEVMEYAPNDLFAIVMTGRMSREEVSCSFLQILSGVTYLHSMGLAHRDLKLDNVVVSDRGIMKIIDFGSAHVFRYPFESGIVLASGIVGSDPYLAPESYDERKYDPQSVDIWSLAIIFCCMSLRRFPWKVPRMTDNSYKLFAAEPTPGHDPKKLIHQSNNHSTTDLGSTPERDVVEGARDEKQHEEPSRPEKPPQPSSDAPAPPPPPPPPTPAAPAPNHPTAEKKEIIRGPWRILRLLPRESRHVIGRMLEIDPKQRIKMSEILEDQWVSESVICRQTEMGAVINADDHTHILEPPSSAPPAT